MTFRPYNSTSAQEPSLAVIKPTFGQRFRSDPIGTASRGLSSIFPGEKLGEALGTQFAAGKQYLQGNKQGAKEILKTMPSSKQVLADAGGAILAAGSFAVPGAFSVSGKFGQNIALGAGLSGTGAIARGDKNVVQQAAIGGAIGGVASGIGQGIEHLVKNLPSRVVKSIVPTASQKPGMVEHILSKPVGSVDKLLSEAKTASKAYNQQVKTILTHPEYLQKVSKEEAGQIMNQVLRQHSTSYATVDSIAKTAQEINPNVAGLIDRFTRGGATVNEINQIRVALDAANNKAFTKISVLPFKKEISVSFQNALRDFVQKSAPETIPIFEKWSKEITLIQGLEKVIKANEKYPLASLRVRWRDILPGIAGFSVGGPVGALGAMAVERTLESPAVGLTGAKAIQAVGRTQPIVSTVNRFGRTQIPNVVKGLQLERE